MYIYIYIYLPIYIYIDWKVISEAQPNFNSEIVPRKYRRFFSTQDDTVSVLSTQDTDPPDPHDTSLNSDHSAINELLPVTSPNYHLRPRN